MQNDKNANIKAKIVEKLYDVNGNLYGIKRGMKTSKMQRVFEKKLLLTFETYSLVWKSLICFAVSVIREDIIEHLFNS